MEFGKAFSFAFEDKDWLMKLGIAALILLIPLLGQIIVLGWALEITRRVIDNDPQPLPDWSDFGGHTLRGILVWVISFVYSLPIILVSACSSSLPAIFQEGGDDTIASVLTIITICLSCLIFLYSVFLGFVLPAALGTFAKTGQLGSAFRFGEVFGLVRAAPAAYLITLLGGIAASFVAMLGIIACFIGVIFTMAYASTITMHLYGQAYNVAVAQRDLQMGEVY